MTLLPQIIRRSLRYHPSRICFQNTIKSPYRHKKLRLKPQANCKQIRANTCACFWRGVYPYLCTRYMSTNWKRNRERWTYQRCHKCERDSASVHRSEKDRHTQRTVSSIEMSEQMNLTKLSSTVSVFSTRQDVYYSQPDCKIKG